MSVLSDADLRRAYPDSRPGPCSIDLHVGDALLSWPPFLLRDPRTDQSHHWQALPTLEHDPGDPTWTLHPGYRYLASTRERIALLPHHAGQVSARSSWGRDGLAVVCGPAGWIDAGFCGYVTLELSVVGSPLALRPGDRIAQLVVFELSSPAERPYAGKYQHQEGPTPSRAHLDGAS